MIKGGGLRVRRDQKNQNANASLRFSKNKAQLYDASERTIKTKTKIGEFILDGKLENKKVDQFSKRKLSQRKVLEQIKNVEQGKKIEKIVPERAEDQKRNLEFFKSLQIIRYQKRKILKPNLGLN